MVDVILTREVQRKVGAAAKLIILNTKFIILNTKLLVFDTQFLVFNAKFIIFCSQFRVVPVDAALALLERIRNLAQELADQREQVDTSWVVESGKEQGASRTCIA